MSNLYSALLAAKSEITPLSKDEKNPFYNSKYFDVNGLLKHIEPILQKNGLLVLQPIMDGYLITQIIHVETGAIVESEIKLPESNDPQKLGSTITYYRRYTLASLLGLQAEDDDANKATKPTTKSKDAIIKIIQTATTPLTLKAVRAEIQKYGLSEMATEKYNELQNG